MSPELAIIFVPGSFSPASIYAPLAEAVKTQGLDVTVVELATVGKKPGPNPTMYDDTAVVAAEVKKHVDQGKDVILVAHSYGGIPATEATKGFSKAEREGEGKKGGVIRLAYLTALVPAVGMAAGQSLKGALRGYVELGEDGWLFHPNPAEGAKYIFNHLSPEAGTAQTELFANHSAISFANELTHASYEAIPVSYFLCEDDMCVTPDNQQRFIGRIEEASGRKVDVTRKFTDHCPHISHPEFVVEWVVGLAEKGRD